MTCLPDTDILYNELTNHRVSQVAKLSVTSQKVFQNIGPPATSLVTLNLSNLSFKNELIEHLGDTIYIEI